MEMLVFTLCNDISLSVPLFLSKKYDLNFQDALVELPLKELFSVDFQNYTEAIRDATKKMAQSTMSLLHVDNILIKFGLIAILLNCSSF